MPGWVAMDSSAQLLNDDDVQKVADKPLRTATDSGKRRRDSDPLGYVRRFLQNWATIAGSIIGIGVFLFTAGNIWFQTDAEAQEAKAAVLSDQAILALDINKERERNDKQDVILGQINGKLDRGEILALKTERRGLRADLDAMKVGAPGRRRLEKQLEEVEDDLKARGVQ